MPLFGGPNVEKLIEKRDLSKLAAALRNRDPGIREQAAQGLIQIGDRAAMTYVIGEMVVGQEEPVIEAGSQVLREMSDTSVPLLADGLRSAPPESRAAYAGLLGRIGPAGLEPLLGTSRDENPEMRAIAAMGLGLIDADDARGRLAEMVNSDDSLEGRAYAGLAMATHKVPGAYETLAGQLDADDPSRRAMAATNLGVLGDPRVRDRIQQLAENDPDQRVRDAAGNALPSLGG